MKIRWLNSFTVALAVTFLSLYLYSLDLTFFQLLEVKAYDFKVSSRGSRPVSGNVVVVAVDEASLEQEGRWPWPRSRLARLIDRLTASKAAVIGMDIIFSEKETQISLEELNRIARDGSFSGKKPASLKTWLKTLEGSDTRLAQSLLKSDRTVLGYLVYANPDQASESTRPIDSAQLKQLDFSQYSLVRKEPDAGDSAPLRPIYAVGLSLPVLMEAANSAGYVSFLPERDGVIRWVPMIQAHKDALFPPLSLQMVREATHLNLSTHLFPERVGEIKLGESPLPVTAEGDFLINYYGPARTFQHFSAAEVLTGKVGEQQLKNKIVLVGATAAAIHDLHTTPYGPLYPGVEVHANIIENILNGDFLQRPSWFRLLDMSVILGAGLILGLGSLFFRAFGTAVLLVLGIMAYGLVDYRLFIEKGWWVHSVYPLFSMLLVYFGITLYRFTFEEREKRYIKEAFSQYLAPTVVNRLVEDPSLLKLGGQRRVVTAFFSDVAGFSSISEKMSAEDLVDLLNGYLTEMTDILMTHEGTVDKFEGDAIIAFFGAPISYEDHARRTCWAALDMQNRLAEMRRKWKQEGKHELHMRIGINTGQVVVGNLGSSNRMDYTMMGDSVNLAARLEGVNKQYQTSTIISQFTYEEAHRDIEVRELDFIRVVGKKQPIRIFELLGRKGQLNDTMREILPIYNKGLEHYRQREWEEGIVCFERVLDIDEDDGPSLTYFERCLTFQAHPPADDWDGVFSMRTK